ncbi:MAG TPA: tail fiber domain-containing protein [Bacteroidia bacterium]|nr:tail fiber domain-containing protein [Bacteroidia bacterium]
MKKNFTICIMLVISVLWSIETNAQSTAADNIWTSVKFLGWGATSGDLPFKTNNTTRMTLQNTTGYLGIGTSFSPAYKLDVDNGDINLNTSTKGYRIGGDVILKTGGSNNNIFVGYNAGNNTMTADYNTIVGRGAGFALSTSQQNTFIGYQAGKSATTYHNAGDPGNVAVGYQALYSNPDLLYNTAIGHQALYLSSTCPDCWDGHSTLNTAVGFQALYSSQGYGGCALGYKAGYSNTIGCGAIAIGEEALLSNTEGDYNIAIGAHALATDSLLGWNVAVGNWALNAHGNTLTTGFSSHNVAIGNWALEHNDPTTTSNGLYNTAVGDYALNDNTTGSYNTIVGYDAAEVATTGSYNSGLGLQVLGSLTTGKYNAAIGYRAGYSITTGDSNVFVGYGADASGTGFGNFHNCAAFGYGAITLGSGKFYFGNANIIGLCTVAAPLFAASDGRFKINVKENVSGLDFINRLRPVTYNMNTKALDAFMNSNRPQQKDSSGKIITFPPGDFTASTNRIHSGFIAQEVEQAALASGFSSSIISLPDNENDLYGLSYAEFVVPLVKAVQELNSKNQELDSKNQALQDQINALKSNNPPASGQGSNESGEQRNTSSIELQNLQTLQLLEADPNPFSESTMIRWNIPNDFKDAMIYFYDNSGTQINSYKIEQKGSGELQVFGSKLSSGIYVYSLIVDSKLIDSKKLVKAK